MKLQDLREKIDDVDGKLTDLLKERMSLVEQVAETKKREHLPILNSGREQEILDRLAESGDPDGMISNIYRFLFEISRSRQQQKMEAVLPFRFTEIEEKMKDNPSVRVACQGTTGAFSSLAKAALFPKSRTIFYSSFEQVASAVESGEADYGILPTHNSNAGSVLEVYDLLARHEVFLTASHKQKICYHLLGIPGAEISDLKTVHSHPQGLAQCKGYLSRRLPGAESKLMSNTAVAAKYVAESGNASWAALSSPQCAEEFHLAVLDENVQDSEFNYTNFVVLAKLPNLSPKNDRISIIASLPHETGTLYRLLTKFYLNRLNLTKIESRPIPGKDFEFLFYLDFDGNLMDKNVSSLLAGLDEELPYFKFLGNY